jgi:hypothetical protein
MWIAQMGANVSWANIKRLSNVLFPPRLANCQRDKCRATVTFRNFDTSTNTLHKCDKWAAMTVRIYPLNCEKDALTLITLIYVSL